MVDIPLGMPKMALCYGVCSFDCYHMFVLAICIWEMDPLIDVVVLPVDMPYFFW